MRRGLLWVMGCGCASWVQAAMPLHLLTQEQAPYTMQLSGGGQAGLALDTVRCAFQRLGQPAEIKFVAWARAQRRVENGEGDGYFPASRNTQRDALSQWFGPVAPQQWRWYLRRDSRLDPLAPGFRQYARVGAYAGSNMLHWLQAQHYQVTVSPPEHDQMLDVLLAGRADAVLAANLAMDKLLMQRGAAGQVRSVLAQDKPLGLYLSHRFLAQQPAAFAGKLQQALARCQPVTPP